MLEGKAAGSNICHVLFKEGNQILYNGQIETIKDKGIN